MNKFEAEVSEFLSGRVARSPTHIVKGKYDGEDCEFRIRAFESGVDILSANAPGEKLLDQEFIKRMYPSLDDFFRGVFLSGVDEVSIKLIHPVK